MKNYTLAEMECAELRVSFVKAMTLMRRLKPNCDKSSRSTPVKLDKYLQRFCNELRRYAAEADQQNT